MKLEDVSSNILLDAISEKGKDSKEYKIIEQSLDVGIEHIKSVRDRDYNGDEKLTRRQMNKNRKKAKYDAYNYLYKNTPATAETVGMGLVASWIFWFALKQTLWWMATKLINYFLFDDESD